MFAVDLEESSLVRGILAAIIVVAALLEFAIIVSYPIPPGSDPGLRVWSARRIAELSERREPDPGFDVVLARLWIVCNGDLGRISSLFAVFLSATSVLPLFIFTKSLTRHNGISLVSGFLVAFAFSVFEALSWGGYTSILALWFISAIFAVLGSRCYGGFREKLLIVSILSSGLLMSHFWSFFVYLSMISLAFLAETLLRALAGRRIVGENAKIGIGSALLGVLISSYWWAPIYPFIRDIITPSFGGSQVAMRSWETGYLLYFLQPNDFYNLYVPIGMVALLLNLIRRHGEGIGNVLILASWVSTPLLLTQSSLLGVSVDYTRLCYFPIAPVVVLSSVGLVVSLLVPYRLLTGLARTVRLKFERVPVAEATKLLSGLIVAYLLARSILRVSGVATAHFFEAAVYYQTVRRPELKGISWMGFTTTRESNIAASSSLAWWINGLIDRDTIASMSLSFITAKWQIPATSAANMILGEVSYQVNNGLMWVEDSNPSGRNSNPAFSISVDGDRMNIAVFGDDQTIIHWNRVGYALSEFNVVRIGWFSPGVDRVSLVTEYQLDRGLRVQKSITVARDTRFIEVAFRVSAPSGDITGLSVQSDCRESLCYGEIVKGRIRSSDLKWATLVDVSEGVSLALIAKKWMRIAETVEEERISRWRMKFYSRGGLSMHAVFYLGAFQEVDETKLKSRMEAYSDNPLRREPGLGDGLEYTDYLSMIESFSIKYIAVRPVNAHKFEVEPRTPLIYSSDRIRIFTVSGQEDGQSA